MKIKQIILSAVVLCAFSFFGGIKAQEVIFVDTPKTKIKPGKVEKGASVSSLIKACFAGLFPKGCGSKHNIEQTIRGLFLAYDCYGGGATSLTGCLREFLTELEGDEFSHFNFAFNKFATTITGQGRHNEFRQIIRILTFDLLKNSGVTAKTKTNQELVPSDNGRYMLELSGKEVSVTPQELTVGIPNHPGLLAKLIEPAKGILGKESLLGGTRFKKAGQRLPTYTGWRKEVLAKAPEQEEQPRGRSRQASVKRRSSGSSRALLRTSSVKSRSPSRARAPSVSRDELENEKLRAEIARLQAQLEATQKSKQQSAVATSSIPTPPPLPPHGTGAPTPPPPPSSAPPPPPPPLPGNMSSSKDPFALARENRAKNKAAGKTVGGQGDLLEGLKGVKLKPAKDRKLADKPKQVDPQVALQETLKKELAKRRQDVAGKKVKVDPSLDFEQDFSGGEDDDDE